MPAAEAGRLTDLFRFLAEGDRARLAPAGFASHLTDGQDLAQALEDQLASAHRDTTLLSAQFSLLNASCKDCHAKYRD